jgi:hypothetical protein
MARFHGEVGYSETVEDPPGSGVWVDKIIEMPYFGDVLRNTRQLDYGDKLNADITVENSISVVADEYAINHFFQIKYVCWAGARWTVSNVEVQRPRLTLRLGRVYNGPTP